MDEEVESNNVNKTLQQKEYDMIYNKYIKVIINEINNKSVLNNEVKVRFDGRISDPISSIIEDKIYKYLYANYDTTRYSFTIDINDIDINDHYSNSVKFTTYISISSYLNTRTSRRK